MGRIKMLVAAAGGVAAVTGAVAGVPKAWVALDLPQVAMKNYVDGHLSWLYAQADQTTGAVRDLRLDILKNRLDAMDKDHFDQAKQLRDKPGDPDAQYRLHRLERDMQDLSAQIEDIRKGHQ